MIDGPYRFLSLVRPTGIGYPAWGEKIQDLLNTGAQQGYAVQWVNMPSTYSLFALLINVNAKESSDAKAEGAGEVTDPPATLSTEV